MLTREQRQWERIPVLCEAKYHNKKDFLSPYQKAELLDIHHQGCRLLADSFLKRGDPISVMVCLPFEGAIHLEGAVAWSAPAYQDRVFEIGIHFLNNDPAAEATYHKLFQFCLFNKPAYKETC